MARLRGMYPPSFKLYSPVRRTQYLLVATSCTLACIFLIIALWVETIGLMFAMSGTVYLLILAAAAYRRLRNSRFDPLEPFWVFIGVYTIYGWTGIISVQMANGRTYVGTPVSVEAEYMYFIAIDVGLWGSFLDITGFLTGLLLFGMASIGGCKEFLNVCLPTIFSA